MALVLSPEAARHIRSGRYAQRERPAATIPARLRVSRTTFSERSRRWEAQLLLVSLAVLRPRT